MTTALQQPSLSSQCMAEFLGTALLIFFGTGCVAALKVAGASFGLWEISIIWGRRQHGDLPERRDFRGPP